MSHSPVRPGRTLQDLLASSIAGGLLLVSLCVQDAMAQPTNAQTRIPNVALLKATTAEGRSLSRQSDTAFVVVGRTGVLTVEPPRQDSTVAGRVTMFAHAVTNRQNTTDSVGFSVTSRRGLVRRLYRDLNHNGVLDASDPVLNGLIRMPAGSVESVLLAVEVPLMLATGISDTLALTVSSASDSSVSATVEDILVATPVTLNAGSLSLTHAADALEARLGGTARLTLTVSNNSTSAVRDIWLQIVLPSGTTYVAGSAHGVDSVFVRDGVASFLVRGELAQGATRQVRYAVAIVSAASENIQFVARTEGSASAAYSANAVARLRLPRDFAMQTRAVIGKVWSDLDGNGVQNASEGGVSAVDVFTTDGQAASTDAEGRFSFANMRTGSHAFRIDPATIPFEYRLRVRGAGEVQFRNQTGWTSSQVNFPLVWRTGVASTILTPLRWSATVTRALSMIAADSRHDAECEGDDDAARHACVRAATGAEPTFVYNVVFEHALTGATPWLRFGLPTEVDSAVVLNGSVVIARSVRRVLSPAQISSGTSFRLRFWSTGNRPIALTVSTGEQQPIPVTLFSVRDSATAGVTQPFLSADSIPDSRRIGRGGAVDLRIAAPKTGWPDEAVVGIPVGWTFEPGSTRQSDSPLADPQVRVERSGRRYLHWGEVRGREILRVRLVPESRSNGQVVRVATARRAGEAGTNSQAVLLTGPGVEIFAPADGAVFSGDRLFVGVRGEAGAPVTLFDGDSAVARGTIRVDGVYDFVSVALSPGPHRLRVLTRSSWGQQRWDSVSAHVSGSPTTIALSPDSLRMIADGHSVAVLRARVDDQWGVPVTHGALVTVRTKGVTVVSPDADRSSVGVQVKSDSTGWLEVSIAASREVGVGSVELSADAGTSVAHVVLLPAVRSLIVTGAGLTGVGAAQDGYGAVTAQGRLGDRTAVNLAYDSRRLDAGSENFGRAQDPLEESQYSLLGDAGDRRSTGASRNRLSARVERGQDWLAFGDLTTSGFASATQLTSYRRALSGIATRMSTGPVEWHGFASSTHQRLGQVQRRGTGSSGPYLLDGDIVPGTELVRLESRAVENAARVVSQQALVRFLDYQIDYQTGTLLFKQPVTAVDPSGNPLFVVVTFETRGTGERRALWGVRAISDVKQSLSLRALDTLLLAATAIRDGAHGGVAMTGGDVTMIVRRALALRGELSRSQSADSSGTAFTLGAALRSHDGAKTLSGAWTRIGAGFTNPSSLALRAGDAELRLAAAYQKNGTRFSLEHEEQTFGAQGVRRERTSGGVTQSLTNAVKLDARIADDRFSAVASARHDLSLAQEIKVSWAASKRLAMWGEGRRHLTNMTAQSRPDMLGAGASLALTPDVSLEARHRHVSNDSTSYAITNMGVRARVATGTDAWSSYQLAGANGAYNAVIVGLNNRLSVGRDWTLHHMFERRHGVGRSLQADPVRALPFLQQEEDYWTLATGAEFVRKDAPYRLSGRGEYRDGAERSSRIATLAGDLALNRSLVVLSRQEVVWSQQSAVSASTVSSRTSSLWGLAFRPRFTNALNLLGKFEWVDAINPAGSGVLARRGSEQRLIGALEGIWMPAPPLELTARVATRRTVAAQPSAEAGALREQANFVGGRANYRVNSRVALRSDGRLLMERTTGTSRWDFAPQVALSPTPVLEIAIGVRVGDLRDPDFAASGGHGAFMTLGTRFTEGTMAGVARFWRERFSEGWTR